MSYTEQYINTIDTEKFFRDTVNDIKVVNEKENYHNKVRYLVNLLSNQGILYKNYLELNPNKSLTNQVFSLLDYCLVINLYGDASFPKPVDYFSLLYDYMEYVDEDGGESTMVLIVKNKNKTKENLEFYLREHILKEEMMKFSMDFRVDLAERFTKLKRLYLNYRKRKEEAIVNVLENNNIHFKLNLLKYI